MNVNIMLIIGLIIGILLGGVLGYVVKWGTDRVVIAELESERDIAVLEMNTMQLQWEIAVNELNKTKVLLNDTLAALELLREYQAIDQTTKDEIKKIDNTLVDGSPTKDTYDAFKKLVEEYNKKNEEYNTASSETTTQSFVELTEKAEELFKTTTDMVIEYE